MAAVYARNAILSPPRSGELRCRYSADCVDLSAVQNASNQKSRAPFRFYRDGKALGMIQQVKVRQQVHGEIAAKRGVAVAAVTTDSSNLDRALIEHDIVALISLGC